MKAYLHLLFIATSLLLGCSSGSENLEKPEDAGESMLIEQAPSVPGVANPDIPEAELSPVVQEPIQAEPVSMTIDFKITVPAYQSNELQVEVTWGDIVVFADWSGDELWLASADIPSETYNRLTITFYDNNGGLVLGRYKKNNYRVNIGSAETFNLIAGQFDTRSWDDDNDGRSNLEEVRTGTDPRLDGTLVLEVWNAALVPSLVFTSENFSRRLPSERPYSFSYSEIPTITEDSFPPWGGDTANIDIAIDENGEGTFDQFYSYRPLDESTLSATRSVTATSTIWEGEQNYYQGWDTDSISTQTSFRSEVANIDENTRSYTGEVSWEYHVWAGYRRSQVYQIDFNLIGEKEEDSSLCIPVEGSINIAYRTSSSAPSVESTSSLTTISKNLADEYWKVKIVDMETENVTSEYYARALETDFGRAREQFAMVNPSGPELQGRFKCEFVDVTELGTESN